MVSRQKVDEIMVRIIFLNINLEGYDDNLIAIKRNENSSLSRLYLKELKNNVKNERVSQFQGEL